MPQLRARHQQVRVVTAEDMPEWQADYVPWEERVGSMVDPTDPALGFIASALLQLRDFGFDLQDPDVVQRAIDKGRRTYELTVRPRQDTNALLDEMAAEEVRPESVVYYMRLGNRVKIGYSTNIVRRLATINPEELLATEPGGHELEKKRHSQFSDLRTNGEWFRYETLLFDHIESIRRGNLTTT